MLDCFRPHFLNGKFLGIWNFSLIDFIGINILLASPLEDLLKEVKGAVVVTGEEDMLQR